MKLSLKAEIMERLDLQKGENNASSNISRATKDFAKSGAPQFKGKSKAKRHQMAVAAGLSAARGESVQPKAGDTMMYEGKKARIQSINESTGLAVIKLPRMRDPKIVRLADLTASQSLNEGFIGMVPITGTFRETQPSNFIRTDLSADDIGLIIHEDEFTGETDDQEEDADNGSNIRYDGHTGKKEVDELPTPSDTIATAYSSGKPPKIMSQPLSTEPGHTVATDPDLHGYDYPADAPEIPKPDFEGEDAGNSRAPSWGEIHDPDHDHDVPEDEDEKVEESFSFITEMENDREPKSGDTITVTLPALASIVCTAAHKCGGDMELMRSMIEALDEVGHGKTIDIDDLQSVAQHMNGEETQEVENRDAGRPDHKGIEGKDSKPKANPWPGDGEKTRDGKTKLMGGVAESEEEEEVDECGDEEYMEAQDNFYSWDDMVAEHRKPTYEEELREMKRRAGLKFWN